MYFYFYPMISESNFLAHLKTIPQQDWDILFDFIPKLQDFEYEKIQFQFLEWYCVKMNLQVIFNWSEWKKGEDLLKENNFENVDTLTVFKLLTAIIRANRFNDGLFFNYVKNGTISQLLMRLQTEFRSK